MAQIADRWGLATKTILHVGAHEAEEYSAYSDHGWGETRTIWVEAQPRLAGKLADQFGHVPNHRVIQSLVSDRAEAVNFYRTNNSQSSSMLPLKLHLVEHPSVTVEEIYRADSARLDEVLAGDQILEIGIEFLNLDIQGAELRALIGLGDHIIHVGAIYSEVNTAELYEEGCATLHEIQDFLCQHGFVLVDIRMTNARWGDALWLPRTSLSPLRRIQSRILVTSHILGARVKRAIERMRRAVRRSASAEFLHRVFVRARAQDQVARSG